jgi:predicted dehydrogenase
MQDLYFYENAQAGSELPFALRTLKGVSEGSMVKFALQRYEPLKAELQAFLKAVRGEMPVAVTGEDGLAALHLALALVESGLKHQVIEV